MSMMDMFENLQSTGVQVAEFITNAQALLNEIRATQTAMSEKIGVIETGHAKLFEQHAQILALLEDIGAEDETEETEEIVEAAETVAEAAETVAAAAETVAEVAAVITEETPSVESVAEVPAETVSETVAEETTAAPVEDIPPEPRKEDDKLIETEVPPAPEKPAKRKRSFIRV